MPLSSDPEKRARQVANLHPWPKGHRGNGDHTKPHVGQMITPAIRRLAQLTEEQFLHYKAANVAEMVAIAYLTEAIQTGAGGRDRDQVLEAPPRRVRIVARLTRG